MNYKELIMQVDALTAGVPHLVANLANASAAIWQEMDRINWAGFYLMEGGSLVLGPFQGKPACIEIPVGRVRYCCGGKKDTAGGGCASVPRAHCLRLRVQLRNCGAHV